SGNSWAVQRGGELINNWDDLIVADDDHEDVEENDEEAPPEYEKEQAPPVALDDEFGARAGRSTVLPVVLNDFDPNGDVLVITAVAAIDENVGSLDLINNRQQLQLTLIAGSTGELTFTYDISDGRGGSASAAVRVVIRADGENSAPVQVRKTKATVAENGRVTASVLGDWVDPDGDAFYLTGAAVAAPDGVSHRPEGSVVFQEGGASAGIRAVALSVSDGQAEGAGTLAVTVRAAGEVPIVAEEFVVLAYAGQTATVTPLEHVRGGTGVLRLSGVPAKTGATISPSYEAGTFTFASDQIRTHLLEYVVTDGDQTVTGIVRVEVEVPPEANTEPITIPKTVFVKTLSSETLQVAAMDIDPAGGVLLVTGVANLDPHTGVRADVLQQRAIRVTLIAPLENGPVSFTYGISNGLAEVQGLVTVIEIPHPDQLQSPVATDDSVTVRVGDAIDVPVLENDAHPDGEALTLNPQLTTGLTAGSGLLFASGSRLRYLAPEQTGNFTAVYEVAGPDGQVAQAQVRIAVREAVQETNNAPVPSVVTARVLAGETVSIRIPLGGIDPDGDSVQLLGQESSPEKGAVTRVGTDFIEYEAGGYSAGTDTFSYTVMDALGARASGTVRVGISAPADGARNPVAIEDEVEARPGSSVSVRVLANDSDPDGGQLTVTSVEPNSPDITATIDNNIVTITPPSAVGRYGLVYTIENQFGGTSSNFIAVNVDPEAARAYPIATDTVLTLSDILDREVVPVDVLSNVFFADGDSRELDLALLSGYADAAAVTVDKKIEVTVGDKSQIIPFAVTHPDDETVVSYAFVWVPGYDDALPQLDRRAKRIKVPSEATVTIELSEYVVAIGGADVQLTDTTTVQATHSNGDSLIVDNDTLRFTSADKYFGPASVSFEVTDGDTPSDPHGRTATLVLPIEVTPRENQPPVFTGGVIEFEPGEEKVLDLLKLTTYPYPDDLHELSYTALQPLPTNFSYSLSGSTLTLRADEEARKGLSTALTLAVRDDLSDGRSGRIQVNVVASSRPLAKPATDAQVVPRGQTTVVDVLANDEATNPFPGKPLQVVAIRGIDGGQLPAGVQVVPSADRSRLSVTVSEEASPADTRLQYQVSDATKDAERLVWGTVTLSVQDAPDAPPPPSRATGAYVGGVLTLRLTAPAFNNSAITRYEVISANNGGYRKDCGMQLRCELTDLSIGAQYEFRVVATNGIGASEPSALSEPMSADYLPDAPASVTAAPSSSTPAAINVSWEAARVQAPGTAVNGYTVTITGPNVSKTLSAGRATSLAITSGLQPNQDYAVTVHARNSADVSEAEWNRSSPVTVKTVGAPSAVTGLAAVVHNAAGHVRVSWTGDADWNGAASGTYRIGRFDSHDRNIPTDCTHGNYPHAIPGATTNPWTDTDVSDGDTFVYVVYADNGLFCTPTTSGAVEVKETPGKATGTATVEQNGTTGQYDIRAGVITPAAVRYQYQFNNAGAWRDVVPGQWLTSAEDASVYGNPQTVTFRACRDAVVDDYCGAPSDGTTVTPVNSRATLTSCVVGSLPVSNDPRNGGSPTVTFWYSYNPGNGAGVHQQNGWTAYSTTEPAPQPAAEDGTTLVRVQAEVTYGAESYRDPGFAEGSCTTP
ncbi:MAG: fibronectin type protein, partial [Homoserinimonas sp.]|nr:fibronectin type protein [Homoserinimonas sp.]